jgi:hypothetical protein
VIDIGLCFKYAPPSQSHVTVLIMWEEMSGYRFLGAQEVQSISVDRFDSLGATAGQY